MNTQKGNHPARNSDSLGESVSNGTSNNAKREEETLKFWKENQIFEKSLDPKTAPGGSGKGNYVFYDGPPFATGLPHYGHILGSTAKDVIGRYQTMRGFRVPRRWGWDCHGLPIENIVEKDLGISGRKAIEEYGVDKFAEHARSSVMTYVGEWKKTVERIGRWVDFDNSYKTMDNSFIESVWWALGQMNDKGLLYEGVRVLAYCPRCETPIANSEIAMDNSYKDIADISVYVKFRIEHAEFLDIFSRFTPEGPYATQKSQEIPPAYLLAWTTTPWTLPGNTAIAINKNFQYVFVKNNLESGIEIVILAKDLFEKLKDKFVNPEIVGEVKGSELVGLSYEPVFDYYKNAEVAKNSNIWKVWHADFVTADTGTGIAHEAPAFGEDDMNLAKANEIPWIIHVDETGKFKKEVADFAGLQVKPKSDDEKARLATDIEVIKYLQKTGTFFAKEKIVHSYPHCYRCDTPLLYYALPSWFVNIQKIKNEALENAKFMNWVPSHLKEGRFKHIMENAPDWTISRNRFWASPLPFWKSADGKLMTVSSLEDLKKKTKKFPKFFVMRHGEAEHNIRGLMTSDANAPYHLTEKGRADVTQKANELREKNIKIIYASPFLRTKETAEIIAGTIGIPKEQIVYDARLGDNHTGEKYEEKPQPNFVDWILDPNNKYSDIPSAGGESFKQIKIRFGNALTEIFAKHPEEEVLIVSHGISFMVIPAILEGADDERSHQLLKNTLGKTSPGEYMEYERILLPHNANYELDLHRPYIDAVTLVDDAGVEYKRIPEVIDCWFESGSMPFAQDHYLGEGDWKEKNFPSGFVAEYIAQTRTWFYYTHIISSTLFNHAPFENVVTTGTLLAEDGQKMSKSKNNFPDPWILFDKYGVDALRFYLMSSTLMKGEDTNFSEKTVQEIASKIVGRLENVLAFYELYRDEQVESSTQEVVSENVLDVWILARLNQLIAEVTENMEKYEMAFATKPFELFIEDLSTWYLRRSRDRLKANPSKTDARSSEAGFRDGDVDAKKTLYFVLKNTAKLLAPFAPFIAEHVWQKLKLDSDAESVHLAEWPEYVVSSTQEVVGEMQDVRDVVNMALKERQKAGIAVRQPLAMLKVKNVNLQGEYLEILKDELNVKSVAMDNSIEGEVWLDMNITPELKKEGEYRELLRAVQDMRKKMGLMPSDEVEIVLSENAKELVENFMQDFQKIVGAKNVNFTENDGEEVKIGEIGIKIKIVK